MSRLRVSKMKFQIANARGFSLVELMVALAAGLIVSSAVVAFMMSSFKSNGDYVISTRLTQELRNTLDLVSRDLRRAGYDEEAMSGMATGRVSPFNRVQFCTGSTCPGAGPITCAIYAYDRNNGTQGVLDVDNGEVRGIRRRSITNINGLTVGVVEYAVSTGTTKPVCNAAGPVYTTFPTVCNATTTWCPLTDPTKLDITTFTMSDGGSNAGGVKLRDITLVMQGRPAGSTEYIRGVKTSVRIRSDCYDTSLANCSLSP
jgi:prepilin-type N-terminal cleavage/methylation domain-containing protein